MSRRNSLPVVIGTLLLASSFVHAAGPVAIWLEPSLKWYGIDGNWSSTRLFVGEPAQEVDVLVSTGSSELWLVENTGCASPLCVDARGGVFDRNDSSSWTDMGKWQLSSQASGIQANGDYGMETVVVYDSVRRWQKSFNKLLVAGINDTTSYIGSFGLGITPGNFGGDLAKSAIASLVEHSGIIPSHSYGYTAGAYYAGVRGVPMSLTLGGYDANRFEPHDVQFSLNATMRQPQTLIRAITASVSDVGQAPTNWSTASIPLSSFNESMIATIDSSTPYLWLPPTICDRFARALDLTWNETFGLYLFSGASNLERYKSTPDLSFTFTLSSLDNRDNFGSPLDMPGLINITISGDAFIQSLRYPFMNLIEYGAPAIPYFPLKRAENGSQVIIGRTFLQESYIITNYETSKFSIHKARFPDNPLRDTSIQTIVAAPNSPYPGPPPVEGNKSHQMSQNQIAGVVVGVCLGLIALVTTFILVRRKRRSFKDDRDEHDPDEFGEKSNTPEPDSPMSQTAMTLFRMKTRAKNYQKKAGNKKGRKKDGHVEAHEVGADSSHARYEMPAPLPVELDATETNTVSSVFFKVASGEDTLGQASYERPQQWSQPPPPSGLTSNPAKNMDGNTRAAHVPPPINTQYLPLAYAENPSPTSSPSQDQYMNGMPSPITPPSDGSTYFGDYPSPIAGFFPTRTLSRSTISNPTMVYTPPSPLGQTDSTSLARSASSVASSSTQATYSLPPQPPIQRTPIDSTHVLCLGPLPNNVRLPHQLMAQKPPATQGPNVAMPPIGHIPIPPIPPTPSYSEAHSRRQSTADTLGSNYTLEEEARVQVTRAGTSAFGRMDGFDIVHVPQMAHRRYSWEE